MCKLNKIVTFILSVSATAFSASIFAFSPSQVPLCLTESKEPMTMLIMGRDHTLFYEAYNDASDLSGDGNLNLSFNPALKYFGYFDGNSCYTYSGSKFSRSNAEDAAGHCSGKWHGKFLNYLTMTRLDVLRKVLYGGKRSTDEVGNTVLIRANIPNDSHVWAKQYPPVAPDVVYQIEDFTPYSAPTSGRHLFASTGTELWVRKNSSDTALKWASQERAGSGDGILYPHPDYSYRFNVAVKVCDSPIGNCKKYGSHYKPTGILQDVGVENNMQFGLITGSYDQNLSGGKLRKNIGPLTDEINTDGTFSAPSSGSIIYNLDRIKITEFGAGGGVYAGTEYKCGWVRHAPLTSGGMDNGVCRDWGNPVGEMLYESLRYFSGASAATPKYIAHNSSDIAAGLKTGVKWNDPFKDSGSFNVCKSPYNLVISDLYPTYDGDDLPGSVFGSFSAPAGDSITPSMSAALSTISAGVSGADAIMGSHFIGEVSGESEGKYNPTAKSFTNLSKVRGLAPFHASQQGSYSSAAMAYWGRSNDIRPAEGGTEVVKTLVVALAAPIPEFNFKLGSKTVNIVPFAKSPITASDSGQQIDKVRRNSSGEITSYGFQPTNAVLDFYVLEQKAGVPTKVQVSFDDVSQGADHDLDAIVEYHFFTSANNGEVDPYDTSSVINLAADEIRIDTEAKYSGSDATTQHLGYVIAGTSSVKNVTTENCESSPTQETAEIIENITETNVSTDVGSSQGQTSTAKWYYKQRTCHSTSGPLDYDYGNEQFYLQYGMSNCDTSGWAYWRVELTDSDGTVTKWPKNGTIGSGGTKGSTDGEDWYFNDGWKGCVYFKPDSLYGRASSSSTCSVGSTTNPSADYGNVSSSLNLDVGDYIFQDISDPADIISYKMKRDEDNATRVSAIIEGKLADGQFTISKVEQVGSDKKLVEVSSSLLAIAALTDGNDDDGDGVVDESTDSKGSDHDHRSNTDDTYYKYSFKTHSECIAACLDDDELSNSLGRMYILSTTVSGITGGTDLSYSAVGDRISDGIYLEVTDQGLGANHSPSISYYLDTQPGEYSFPDNQKYNCGAHQGGRLPYKTSRTFKVSTSSDSTTASVLRSPLWYAAKWGGFIETNDENNLLDKDIEWDKDNDKEPDNFWLVVNADTLSESLRKAFNSIIDDSNRSDSALVSNSGSVEADTMLYNAMYEGGSWSGDVVGTSVSQSGNTVTFDNEFGDSAEAWSVKAAMNAQFYAGVDSRLILTSVSGGNDLFASSNAALKTEIVSNSDLSVSGAINLINYIRGDNTNEGTGNGQFRERVVVDEDGTQTRFILGDIIHSSPAVSGEPNYRFSGISYKEYYDSHKDRTPVLIFGANDGMVHVVNAEKDSANKAKELFAYVPSQMFRPDGDKSYLEHLTSASYKNDHRYYVDGPIIIADAFGKKTSSDDDAWHTLAIGSLGGGGKGYYALDITDPDPATAPLDGLTASEDTFNSSHKTSPVQWERTDLGYVYGEASFGKINLSTATNPLEDQWVAVLANGYGMSTPTLHIVDIMTGLDVISIDTASTVADRSYKNGCVTTGGLSPASIIIEDGVIRYAYAGDLNGNMWKFDLTDPLSPISSCLFTATHTEDGNTTPQSITVAPTIVKAPAGISGYMIYFGTGKHLENSDKSDLNPQDFYAVIDEHTDVTERAKVPKTSLFSLSVSDEGNSREITSLIGGVNYVSDRGYRIPLPAAGERIIQKAKILLGSVYVATLIAGNTSACESGCEGMVLTLSGTTGTGTGTLYKNAQVPTLLVVKDPDCDDCESHTLLIFPGKAIKDDTDTPTTDTVTNAVDIIDKSDDKDFIDKLNGDGKKSWRAIY